MLTPEAFEALATAVMSVGVIAFPVVFFVSLVQDNL